MLKSEKRTINGTVYEVTQLPYSKGKPILLKLFKILGPSVSEALAKAPEVKNAESIFDQDFKLKDIAPALSAGVKEIASF